MSVAFYDRESDCRTTCRMVVAWLSSMSPPDCDHVPAGKLCVSEDLWRQYCYAGQIAESDKPDAKRQAFNRVAKSLLAKWSKYASWPRVSVRLGLP